MEGEELRELQRRGRFFARGFPGTKASEESRRHQNKLEARAAGNTVRPTSAANDEPVMFQFSADPTITPPAHRS